MPDRITLAFGAEPGSTFDARNSATTRMRAYSSGQLLRDRRETVDFTTRATVTARDRAAGVFESTVTTLTKEGKGALRAMAYPERGETIAYRARTNGRVLSAGHYPRDSVFYIPSLPMPAGEVTVGDTWAMEHEWTSGAEAFPLRIEVIGILRAILPCRGTRVCADVEISGHVLLAAPSDRPGARFDSRVRGRALFDLDRGDVTWTEVRSREEITLGTELSLVDSCLVSWPAIVGAPAPACDPAFEADIVVPEL